MKTTLRNALGKGIVNVTFTKADGSRREMRATTNEGLFTYESRGGDTAEPQGVIRVWDGRRMMERLPSHHALVMVGDHTADLRMIGSIFGLGVEDLCA